MTAPLKVTPEILTAKAGSISHQASEMKTNLEALHKIMNRTKGYWLGTAGDAYRKSWQAEKQDMDKMIMILKAYPEKLTVMAGNYVGGIKQNVSDAQALTEQVIV